LRHDHSACVSESGSQRGHLTRRRALGAVRDLAVVAVLSPALAVLATAAGGDEAAVRQEGKPCVVDRAEDVVGDRRLVDAPAV
jgi:hypothetical protein